MQLKLFASGEISKYDGFAERFSSAGVKLVVESFTEAAHVLTCGQNVIKKMCRMDCMSIRVI